MKELACFNRGGEKVFLSVGDREALWARLFLQRRHEDASFLGVSPFIGVCCKSPRGEKKSEKIQGLLEASGSRLSVSIKPRKAV